MTGQSLLDRMELLDAELQLQTGEADVVKGLVALNVAQDYFESVAAQRPNIFGSGTGTVTTASGVETTAYPTGLYRIDRLQYIDASTSKPAWDVQRLQRVGGHTVSTYWPYNLILTTTGGKPKAYWTNGTSIYWAPIPDGTYTIRWYGFQAAADITAGGTFAYPDIVALPIASFAARLMKSGLDDNIQDLASLALEAFSQTLDALGNANRDGAIGLSYTQVHTE